MNANLKLLGFDLAYLAMLTKEGLKPLSRWEPGLTDEQVHILSDYGLTVKKIRRIANSRLEVYEHVFSLFDDSIGKYTKWFNNQPLNLTEFHIYTEGRLFGYPECCVFNFLRHGYRENGFSEYEQSILFHWACDNCLATKLLIPEYRRIYRQCLDLFDLKTVATCTPVKLSFIRSKNKKVLSNSPRRTDNLRLSMPIVASVLLACGLSARSDAHLPIINQFDDSDRDYLTDVEEGILSFNPADPDEDQNKVPDGIDLAKRLANIINKLPDTPSSNHVYAIPHMAFGLETCNVCKQQVNMGFLQVINPLENYEINIPFIAIHYLEHGSFVYSGSVHSGKIKPPVIKTALESNGLTHFIQETNGIDSDNDGLLDLEEKFFTCLPDEPDTNKNGIRDGIEIARNFLNRLKNLPRASDINSGPKDRPFVIEHPMDGYETCPRCGESIAMDWWLVYNPKNNLQISIPSMALHFMNHGGFRWDGGQIFEGTGRVSAKHLSAILDETENGHFIPAKDDSDEDGIKDSEEAIFLLSPQNSDTDENGIKDGSDLAMIYSRLIAKLPRGETNGTYVIEHPMRGFVYCPTCASSINMGYIEIINRERNINCQLSYLRLHYLEHGSLTMPVDEYMSPILFSDIFKADVILSCSSAGLRFRWKGESGKKYAILVSESLSGPWSVHGIYEGMNDYIEIDEPAREKQKFFRILIY